MRTTKSKLDRLWDALEEVVLRASPKDTLDEARRDGKDVDAVIERTRAAGHNAILEAKRKVVANQKLAS